MAEDAAVVLVREEYLARIGLRAHEIETVVSGVPSLDQLRLLCERHITSVPFENMSCHAHPAEGDLPAIEKDPPVLNVSKSLQKIVFRHRGGFCFEINFCFAWLLRALGYKVRLGNAQVLTPSGPTPGHCVCLVDLDQNESFLVDCGFGDGLREPVPLSCKSNKQVVKDRTLGDTHTLAATSDYGPNFNTVYMRGKANANATMMHDLNGTPQPGSEPTDPRPAHIFNDTDDLEMDSAEFQHGIGCMLAADSIFSMKRICSLGTPNGNITIGQDYIKHIEGGVEVSRKGLPTQAEYRNALDQHFGVVLENHSRG